jgi:hypothetical protein
MLFDYWVESDEHVSTSIPATNPDDHLHPPDTRSFLVKDEDAIFDSTLA